MFVSEPFVLVAGLAMFSELSRKMAWAIVGRLRLLRDMIVDAETFFGRTSIGVVKLVSLIRSSPFIL